MKNQLKTLMLLGVLSAILLGVGSLLGTGAFWISMVLAAAMNLGAYFFSDRIVLRMSGAQEVSPAEAPALHSVVEELAVRAGIPKPKVYLIPDAQPNAFATGRNPEKGVVAVTEGLLRLMGEREVRGVLAHEIAHIKNRDILVASVAAMFAAAIGHLAHVLTFSALFGGRSEDEGEGAGGGGLLAMLVAPIAATLVQLAISRSREYLADETAARITGDPEGLASALERLEVAAGRIPAEAAAPATASLYIVNPLAGASSLANLFSTHPPIPRRVTRLRDLSRHFLRAA